MNPEAVGSIGTAFVVLAYAPQIYHLLKHRECACGISFSSWTLWLVAGLLLISYAIMRSDVIFTIVQAVNIGAILAIMILAKTRRKIC